MSLLKDAIYDKALNEEVSADKQAAAKRAFKVFSKFYDQIEDMLDTIDDLERRGMQKDMNTLGYSDKDYSQVLKALTRIKPDLRQLQDEDLDVLLPGLEMTSRGEE